MSNINTNGINANYPVPGENNPSQGFRDNFSAIKNNLNTAGSEISDLQSKVLLKQALIGIPINNDMNGTLISNVLTKGFRASTYNLGNNLQGTITIDVSRADVHYGTVTGNVSLSFSSWSPQNTKSQVILQLTVNDPTAVITFPSSVVQTILENAAVPVNSLTVTAPYDTDKLEFLLSTVDCGTTITIEPLNRPYQTTQIVKRSPPPTGNQGDREGTVAVDDDYLYVCTGNYDATLIETLNVLSTNSVGNLITLSSDATIAGVSVNMPVVFDTMEVNGTSVINFGNIVSGKVYYVKTISGSDITISDIRTAGTAGTTFAVTTVGPAVNTGTDTKFYDGTDIWKRIALTAW